jgi:hypothetical protein
MDLFALGRLKVFLGMAPGVGLLPDSAGYRLYIESLFDELSTEIKVLFDRRDPASVLWPKRATLTNSEPACEHRLVAVVQFSPHDPKRLLVGCHVAVMMMAMLDRALNRRSRVASITGVYPLAPVFVSFLRVFQDRCRQAGCSVAE